MTTGSSGTRMWRSIPPSGRSMRTAPTLLRAGFADYGEERRYWLPIS
jgi:hypothetical protein